MQDSLYVIRPEIDNQCSVLRSGLVCSCREDLRINLQMRFGFFGVYVPCNLLVCHVRGIVGDSCLCWFCVCVTSLCEC